MGDAVFSIDAPPSLSELTSTTIARLHRALDGDFNSGIVTASTQPPESSDDVPTHTHQEDEGESTRIRELIRLKEQELSCGVDDDGVVELTSDAFSTPPSTWASSETVLQWCTRARMYLKLKRKELALHPIYGGDGASSSALPPSDQSSVLESIRGELAILCASFMGLENHPVFQLVKEDDDLGSKMVSLFERAVSQAELLTGNHPVESLLPFLCILCQSAVQHVAMMNHRSRDDDGAGGGGGGGDEDGDGVSASVMQLESLFTRDLLSMLTEFSEDALVERTLAMMIEVMMGGNAASSPDATATSAWSNALFGIALSTMMEDGRAWSPKHRALAKLASRVLALMDETDSTSLDAASSASLVDSQARLVGAMDVDDACVHLMPLIVAALRCLDDLAKVHDESEPLQAGVDVVLDAQPMWSLLLSPSPASMEGAAMMETRLEAVQALATLLLELVNLRNGLVLTALASGSELRNLLYSILWAPAHAEDVHTSIYTVMDAVFDLEPEGEDESVSGHTMELLRSLLSTVEMDEFIIEYCEDEDPETGDPAPYQTLLLELGLRLSKCRCVQDTLKENEDWPMFETHMLGPYSRGEPIGGGSEDSEEPEYLDDEDVGSAEKAESTLEPEMDKEDEAFYGASAREAGDGDGEDGDGDGGDGDGDGGDGDGDGDGDGGDGDGDGDGDGGDGGGDGDGGEDEEREKDDKDNDEDEETAPTRSRSRRGREAPVIPLVIKPSSEVEEDEDKADKDGEGAIEPTDHEEEDAIKDVDDVDAPQEASDKASSETSDGPSGVEMVDDEDGEQPSTFPLKELQALVKARKEDSYIPGSPRSTSHGKHMAKLPASLLSLSEETNLELFVCDEDFERQFGVSKSKWGTLPVWKKTQLKQKAQLH